MSENTEPIVAVEETAAAPVQEKKVKKVKKTRSVPLKIFMGLIAFVLCIVMFAVSVVGMVILNLRVIVSENGISSIITQLVSGPTASVPQQRPVLAAGFGGMDLSGVMGDTTTIGGDFGVSGALVDWAYDYVQSQFGEEMEITKEQVQEFVENSTVKDFVAEKAAGLVQDFYSGESNTTITTDEITELIEENAEILEEQFGLVINQEALDIVDQVIEESGFLEPVEEEGLMGYIQQSMGGGPAIDGDASGTPVIPGGDSQMMQDMLAMQQAMEVIRNVTSYTALAILAGVMAFLMLLLFFVNGGISAMLSQTGVILTLTGLIFSAPAIVCQTQPALLLGMLEPMVAGIVISIFTATAWVNYTVLGVGLAMIVAAIVIKIVKNAKKKAVA